MVLHFHLHSKCDSDLCCHCTDVGTEALENENLSQLVETEWLLMVGGQGEKQALASGSEKELKKRSNLQRAGRGPEEVSSQALEEMTSFMAWTIRGGSQSKDQQGTLLGRQVQDL